MKPNILFANAIFFELVSWVGLTIEQPAVAAWVFVLTHTIASLLAGFAVWCLLPAQYQQPVLRSYAFVALLIFFIPGLGMVGVVVSILLGLYRPHEQRPEYTLATAVPELPFKPVTIDTNLSFAGGGLYDVLRHASDTDKRLKAVLATQRMNERKAIPILQVALKDPVDDVRLLAYSILDNKENGINVNIKSGLTELQTATEAQRPVIHKRLAFLYWELVYMGLAQGDVMLHILRTAKQHVNNVLQQTNDSGAYFLLGRILIREQALVEAEQAFMRAHEYGMDKSIISSYLAEIAYLSRDYKLIPSILRELPDAEREREPIAAVAEYWLQA